MTITKLLTIIFCAAVATLYFQPVKCERVLAIAPLSGRSHWNIVQGVLRALTKYGHQVTVLTPFLEGSRENYTEIDLSDVLDPYVQFDINTIHEIFKDYTATITFIHDHYRDTCKTIYQNDVLQKIMADTDPKFDVIFIEYVASECFSYLSFKLNIPLVYINNAPIMSYSQRMILGDFVNPAYVANTLFDHSVPRTFQQRFKNTMLLIYTTYFLQLKIWFSSLTDRQPFDAIEPIKPSIVFNNAHFVSDPPRPILPNVIQVGGIHLDSPKKIPDDILEFIENSPNGVIFFNLGSLIRSSSLPEHIKGVILNVLGQVPQRVLLKYEEKMMNAPKNMMIKKWFPQRDILLHPNVKLFISTGGICGLYEAIDAGVPVIGFPLFFDHWRNMKNLVDAGMAISMDLLSLSKDNFSNSVSELLSNEKYLKNAKITSQLFKDRPMSPEQEIDYWTRYVVRHKGAPHLKSQALNLPLYQYLLLDVLAVLLIVISLFVFIVYIMLKFIRKNYNRILSYKMKYKFYKNE